MEVKERYEWDKIEGYEWIRDTEKGNQPLYYDLKTVAHILNKQDKLIKELEQENQQLKQQLKDTEESYNNTMRYLNKIRSGGIYAIRKNVSKKLAYLGR